jgi:hypothetical protein
MFCRGEVFDTLLKFTVTNLRVTVTQFVFNHSERHHRENTVMPKVRQSPGARDSSPSKMGFPAADNFFRRHYITGAQDAFGPGA